MTKPFSALAAILVASHGLPVQADTLQDFWAYADRFGAAWSNELYHGGSAPAPQVELHDTDGIRIPPPVTASVPDWVFDRIEGPTVHVDLLRWSSTRPETWGHASASYQIAHPGPTYVGLIPQPVPDGWVVTNRCLAWDNYYADEEHPFGDCYIFEIRPIVIGPVVID